MREHSDRAPGSAKTAITHFTYQGPPIDDPSVLEQVPAELASLLRQINGYIQFGGALHIRGATKHPSWHSLRLAFEGPHALRSLYPTVLTKDVPFAQDCVDDQYIPALFARLGDHIAIDGMVVDFSSFRLGRGLVSASDYATIHIPNGTCHPT